MAYYDALIAKWSTITGTTAQKLAAVNALTIAGPTQPVPVLTLMTYLRTNNLWMQIKAAVGTSAGAAAAVDYNSDPRVENIDVPLPIVQAMLGEMKSKGLLSDQNIADINAMAVSQVPWWQANGYSGPFNGNDLLAGGLS